MQPTVKYYSSRYRGFTYTYDVFPDYWKPKWGPLPRLGVVKADSDFDAIRAAYDAKFLTINFTFGPLVVRRVRKPKT
jgi:hypothetical protein